MNLKILLALISFSLTSIATYATEIAINASDSGWYRDGGFHESINKNTLTGNLASIDYRSFYLWEIPEFNESVISARVDFEIYYSLGAFGGDDQLATVFDVNSTNIALLTTDNGSGHGREIFNDLGSGLSYGEFNVASFETYGYILSVNLNSNAIEAINNSKGQSFAFGIVNNTPYLENKYFLFSDSSGVSTQTLSLEIEQVPEPQSYSMFLLGIFFITALLLRRNTKSANSI